jgi:transposase InsO family protein
MSDNGPQFTAQEFKKHVERHQIKHVKTPVYHPQSNGQAENFVKTFKFKQALKKNITENTNTEI